MEPLPRVRDHLVRSGESGALVVFADDFLVLGADGPCVNRIAAVLDRFDGATDASHIALETGADVAEVVALGARLEAEGLVAAGPSDTPVPGRDAADALIAHARLHARRCADHELFWLLEERYADRPRARAVLLGLVVETRHLIGAAAVHIDEAIEHCGDPTWRDLLEAYRVDEGDHAAYVSSALAAMGVDPERVEWAPPLAATASVVTHLRAAARADPLVYLAALAVIETDGIAPGRPDADMGGLFTDLGFPPTAWTPLGAHLAVDDAAAHAGLVRRALATGDVVDRRRLDRAVEWMGRVGWSVDAWHDQVLDWYGDRRRPVPAPTCFDAI